MASTPVITAIAALTLSIPALAGPLDPPAGPITSTHKTLTQVEPRTPISLATTPGDVDSLFKITQPGSYYLTGNVTGVAAKRGIEIAASNVSIDLNGFELAGVPTSLAGISATASDPAGIEIRNGSITRWNKGIDLLSARSSVMSNLRVNDNTGDAILTGPGSVISFCTATRNAGDGFTMLDGSTISNCAAVDNDFSGFELFEYCVVTACTAAFNGDDGVIAGASSTITACTMAENANDGVLLSSGTISGCTVRLNGADGIRTSGTSTLTNNHCVSNTGDGIRLSGGGRALANVCAGNNAGIRVAGGDNRIEGNHCDGNAVGVNVTSTGNLILRNTCTGNTTNWIIVAGNNYGPIIDRTDNTGPAVNGNAAGAAIGSSDSTANFTY